MIKRNELFEMAIIIIIIIIIIIMNSYFWILLFQQTFLERTKFIENVSEGVGLLSTLIITKKLQSLGKFNEVSEKLRR